MQIEGTHIPTLNSMGYMTKILDPYCEEFISYCRNVKNPIADLGVAFGHTTKEILKQGATVYANDIENKHLNYLITQLTEEEKSRLKLFPGKIPDVFNFEENFFSGVLAARCFHFLKGEEIEDITLRIYKSLIKGGKLCVVAETPYTKHTTSFIPLYEERKIQGSSWPGFIDDFKKFTTRKNTTDWINLLDPDVLERTLKLCGFKIEKVGFIERPYFPEEVRLDGKESVGIIGIK